MLEFMQALADFLLVSGGALAIWVIYDSISEALKRRK
jgi:hypothetical protein